MFRWYLHNLLACSGKISCVNDNEFFARFYEKYVDKKHKQQENGAGFNASKYIDYIIKKRAHSSTQSHSGEDDAADSYFRDVRYFVACPALLKTLALPKFMR